MKPTDTSEKGLESIIVASLVEQAGYIQGDSEDYDRKHAVDLAQLRQFLAATHTRIPHPADFRCGHGPGGRARHRGARAYWRSAAAAG